MTVLRFFKDDLTGDEYAIAWNGTEEICITEAQAYDILAEEQAQQNSYENGLLFH
tara:strand:+ start:364 stop:528 length:165 start_codon:yes stop_codon:yes gene_type:complete